MKPDIVILWASPEVNRLWFFQDLLKSGKIQHLIYRNILEEESKLSISYMESRNIKLGLTYIKNSYYHYYTIVQAADISAKNETYKYIDTEMQDKDTKAVLFFWNNGIANENVWHTNFFAVKDDSNYWPPISEKDEGDTLEVQWGKHLSRKRFNSFIRNHNSRNQKFDHNHESEHLPIFPVQNQKLEWGINFSITGHKTLYRKFKEFFKRYILWRK